MPAADAPKPIGDPLKDVAALQGQQDELRDWYSYPPWCRPRGENVLQATWPDPNLHSTNIFTVGSGVEPVTVYVSVEPAQVVGRQPLTVTIKPLRGSEQPIGNLPFEATGELQRWNRQAIDKHPDTGGWEPLGKLTFVRNGDVWRATATPSALPGASDAYEMRALVSVKVTAPDAVPPSDMPPGVAVPGVGVGVGEVPFVHEPVASIDVVRFTNERIEDGSLVVDLDFNAQTTGALTVNAGLFDAKGTSPVAGFVRTIDVTETGRQVVPIIFYGKVLHDVGVDGPYRIQYVRGELLAADFRKLPWRFDKPYMTGTYKAASFADRDYNGPDKVDALAAYDKQIREFRQQARDRGMLDK